MACCGYSFHEGLLKGVCVQALDRRDKLVRQAVPPKCSPQGLQRDRVKGLVEVHVQVVQAPFGLEHPAHHIIDVVTAPMVFEAPVLAGVNQAMLCC